MDDISLELQKQRQINKELAFRLQSARTEAESLRKELSTQPDQQRPGEDKVVYSQTFDEQHTCLLLQASGCNQDDVSPLLAVATTLAEGAYASDRNGPIRPSPLQSVLMIVDAMGYLTALQETQRVPVPLIDSFAVVGPSAEEVSRATSEYIRSSVWRSSRGQGVSSSSSSTYPDHPYAGLAPSNSTEEEEDHTATPAEGTSIGSFAPCLLSYLSFDGSSHESAVSSNMPALACPGDGLDVRWTWIEAGQTGIGASAEDREEEGTGGMHHLPFSVRRAVYALMHGSAGPNLRRGAATHTFILTQAAPGDGSQAMDNESVRTGLKIAGRVVSGDVPLLPSCTRYGLCLQTWEAVPLSAATRASPLSKATAGPGASPTAAATVMDALGTAVLLVPRTFVLMSRYPFFWGHRDVLKGCVRSWQAQVMDRLGHAYAAGLWGIPPPHSAISTPDASRGSTPVASGRSGQLSGPTTPTRAPLPPTAVGSHRITGASSYAAMDTFEAHQEARKKEQGTEGIAGSIRRTGSALSSSLGQFKLPHMAGGGTADGGSMGSWMGSSSSSTSLSTLGHPSAGDSPIAGMKAGLAKLASGVEKMVQAGPMAGLAKAQGWSGMHGVVGGNKGAGQAKAGAERRASTVELTQQELHSMASFLQAWLGACQPVHDTCPGVGELLTRLRHAPVMHAGERRAVELGDVGQTGASLHTALRLSCSPWPSHAVYVRPRQGGTVAGNTGAGTGGGGGAAVKRASTQFMLPPFPSLQRVPAAPSWTLSLGCDIDSHAFRAAAAEYACPVLFSLLPLDSVLLVLGALLSECKVIVVGGDMSGEATSACVLALHCLVYPLTWSGPFLPTLPASLFDILSAPVPVLAGCASVPTDYVQDESTVLVFLDTEQVVIPPGRITAATNAGAGSGGGGTGAAGAGSSPERSHSPAFEQGIGSASPHWDVPGFLQLQLPFNSELFYRLTPLAACLRPSAPTQGDGLQAARPCYKPSAAQVEAVRTLLAQIEAHITERLLAPLFQHEMKILRDLHAVASQCMTAEAVPSQPVQTFPAGPRLSEAEVKAALATSVRALRTAPSMTTRLAHVTSSCGEVQVPFWHRLANSQQVHCLADVLRQGTAWATAQVVQQVLSTLQKDS